MDQGGGLQRLQGLPGQPLHPPDVPGQGVDLDEVLDPPGVPGVVHGHLPKEQVKTVHRYQSSRT